MKGLELAKSYYEEIAKPLLQEKFPEIIDKIAIGLVGSGSECFGYDDDISLDHDFEAGFSIWINDEIEKEYGFKLFRFYQSLPSEYKGVKLLNKSVVGSKNKGVHTINEFYSFYIGNEIPSTLDRWLQIDDFYLKEATNGEVFYDPSGEFTNIRNKLLNRPEDVRLKKLASNLFYMAQYGQYNYQRCFKHNELLSASLCLSKFVEHTSYAIYLLNKEYAPYYKWLFKGLDKLDKLSNVKQKLEKLMKSPYNKDENIKLIEEISKEIINQLKKDGYSNRDEDYLEGYAYDVNNKIHDAKLKVSPIML